MSITKFASGILLMGVFSASSLYGYVAVTVRHAGTVVNPGAVSTNAIAYVNNDFDAGQSPVSDNSVTSLSLVGSWDDDIIKATVQWSGPAYPSNQLVQITLPSNCKGYYYGYGPTAGYLVELTSTDLLLNLGNPTGPLAQIAQGSNYPMTIYLRGTSSTAQPTSLSMTSTGPLGTWTASRNVHIKRRYVADPAGSSGNQGTLSSPWDLRSALTTQTIPAGETLWLVSGTYSDPIDIQGEPEAYDLDRKFAVTQSNFTIRPLISPRCGDPTPVLVLGGFGIDDPSTSNIIIREIAFENPDPAPGESGLPVAPPGSVPPGVWGWGGVSADQGVDHKIINCIATGGAGSFSGFNAEGTEWYGNIAYDFGWEGTYRMHGHGFYVQNDSTLAADRITFRHNLVSTDPWGSEAKGNWALHLYGQSVMVQNMTVDQNCFLGPVWVGAYYAPNYCSDITFTNNVSASVRLVSDGNSFGLTGLNDDLIVFQNNSFYNGVKRLESYGWTNVTNVNTFVYKTNPSWSESWIGGGEVGTFLDISGGGGGSDIAHVWSNVYHSTYGHGRANIVVRDHDLDGYVTVNLGYPNWFLNSNQRVSIYRHDDLISKVATYDGTYTGPITLPVVNTEDSVDAYVAFREWLPSSGGN